MKKFLLIFAVMLTLGIAQPAKAGIEFGLEAGMNLSKLSVSKNLKQFTDPQNRYGFYVGPKMNFNFLGFGGDVALLYNQRRLSLTDHTSKTFRSVEVPVNFRYTLGLSSLAAVYASTGPQFGFNIGSRKWGLSNITEGRVTDVLKRENMNVSWNIGAGVKLAGHIELGVGYNIMLSKYAKTYGADTYSFRANTFQVQVAYLF